MSEARLDEVVRRILTGMVATGGYDDPTPATMQPLPTDAAALVARRVAEAGAVLLKNLGGLLPLNGQAKRIVLIGGAPMRLAGFRRVTIVAHGAAT